MKGIHIPFLLVIVIHAVAITECATSNNAANANKKAKKMEQTLAAVTRQLMLQQFFNEQRVRSEGQSGIKIVRQRRSGMKNYFVDTHTGRAAASIHDHSNNIRTIGMGELTVVMNGIEFQTRHNDYRLYMPSQTSKNYHTVEPVPFPDIPPAVKNKDTVDEQIAEMREWFKAWRDQDHSVRDYRKFFKPVLCYLEGAWTNSGSKIDEPFSSDRHFIDAKSWMELHEKARYVAYSGTKSRNENLSFLPTKIMKLINNTIPEFAQWNYRILCHPLKDDLQLDRLRVVEDLSSRMMTQRNIHQHVQSRAARFQVNSRDSDTFNDRAEARKGFLDDLMEQIPGKDNYQGNLTDKGLDGRALNSDKTVKDVSRYHRWFTIPGRDAMGVANIHRGYNDEFMFAAMTTQPKVASIDLKKCGKYNKLTKRRPCWLQKQKWTYAIPLEVIYLTPLNKWNPYDLKYHGDHKQFKNVAQNSGRNGKCTSGKELNGTTSKLYYRTPAEFYTGEKTGKDAADTDRGVVCVLDKEEKARKVRASGVHVFLPNIKGVGVLRQRYPIFPVHGEGSSVWKELNALREIVMDPTNWKYMFWNSSDVNMSEDIEIETGISRSSSTSSHTHKIQLTPGEIKELKGGKMLTKETSLASGHQHTLIIRWNNKKNNYYYQKCDGKNRCWDRHDKYFTE